MCNNIMCIICFSRTLSRFMVAQVASLDFSKTLTSLHYKVSSLGVLLEFVKQTLKFFIETISHISNISSISLKLK